jgi:hypothetical protein
VDGIRLESHAKIIMQGYGFDHTLALVE